MFLSVWVLQRKETNGGGERERNVRERRETIYFKELAGLIVGVGKAKMSSADCKREFWLRLILVLRQNFPVSKKSSFLL